MGRLPEYAKDMRVPVNQKEGLVDSGAIAWLFYERRKRHQGVNEPTVTIARHRTTRRKAVSTVYFAPTGSGDRSFEALVARVVSNLLVNRVMPLFTEIGRLVRTRVSPGMSR